MNSEMDDLSNHLGSSALLDDTDIAMTANSKEPYHTGMAPGPKPFQRGAWGLAQYMGETVNRKRAILYICVYADLIH